MASTIGFQSSSVTSNLKTMQSCFSEKDLLSPSFRKRLFGLQCPLSVTNRFIWLVCSLKFPLSDIHCYRVLQYCQVKLVNLVIFSENSFFLSFLYSQKRKRRLSEHWSHKRPLHGKGLVTKIWSKKQAKHFFHSCQCCYNATSTSGDAFNTRYPMHSKTVWYFSSKSAQIMIHFKI